MNRGNIRKFVVALIIITLVSNLLIVPSAFSTARLPGFYENDATFDFTPSDFVDELKKTAKTLKLSSFKGTLDESDDKVVYNIVDKTMEEVFVTMYMIDEKINRITIDFFPNDDSSSDKTLARIVVYMSMVLLSIEDALETSECGGIVLSLLEEEDYEGEAADFNVFIMFGCVCLVANPK